MQRGDLPLLVRAETTTDISITRLMLSLADQIVAGLAAGPVGSASGDHFNDWGLLKLDNTFTAQ